MTLLKSTSKPTDLVRNQWDGQRYVFSGITLDNLPKVTTYPISISILHLFEEEV